MTALKRIRKQKGFYTQASLSEASGVYCQTINLYENRKKVARKANMCAIAYVLGVKYTEIFGDDGLVKND